MRILLQLAFLVSAALASAGQPADSVAVSQLQDEAVRALDSDGTLPLERWAPLVERLRDASKRAPAPGDRGQLTLLWLRALRALLQSIPVDAEGQRPYQPWLDANTSLITYSEPSGQWLIVEEMIWQAHDEHRSTDAAEEIAWLAAENGLPGECEGYVPCYTSGLNRLEGEYLRRHPDGRHASEAVKAVLDSLEMSLERLSEPDGKDYFDPAGRGNCEDLRKTLEPLMDAVRASAGDFRPAAIAAADRLLAMCR